MSDSVGRRPVLGAIFGLGLLASLLGLIAHGSMTSLVAVALAGGCRFFCRKWSATLLRVIADIVQPSSGSVQVLGGSVEPQDVPIADVRQDLAGGRPGNRHSTCGHQRPPSSWIHCGETLVSIDAGFQPDRNTDRWVGRQVQLSDQIGKSY